MRRLAVLGLGIAVTIFGSTAVGCTSLPITAPRASAARPPPALRVSDLKLVTPAQDGQPYRIEALINHETAGGRAAVTFRLRHRATTESHLISFQLELSPGVAVVAVGRLQAPRGDYAPEVELRYPVR
jgi:hypothetical protein